jgi:hypothetical protein
MQLTIIRHSAISPYLSGHYDDAIFSCSNAIAGSAAGLAGDDLWRTPPADRRLALASQLISDGLGADAAGRWATGGRMTRRHDRYRRVGWSIGSALPWRARILSG